MSTICLALLQYEHSLFGGRDVDIIAFACFRVVYTHDTASRAEVYALSLQQ